MYYTQAGFIVPMIASTNLVMFCLIIPQGIKYLRVKLGVSGIRANILTTKASLITLVFGCIGIGLVPNFTLFLISKLPTSAIPFIKHANTNHILNV
jgi:hypothetical protein